MKISIITTNFNTDKYLEQTIKSILSQKGDFDLELRSMTKRYEMVSGVIE